MDKPTAALLLTLLVHVVGMAALVWLAFDGERFDWRGWWPRDEGGGGGPRSPDEPDDGPGGGVPLDGALPARVRLRTEHERLRDAGRRPRRPVHEPDRPREPAPAPNPHP